MPPTLLRRRFTLLDAMILLASSAVGLAVVVNDAETDLEGNILARVGEGMDDRPGIPAWPVQGWTSSRLLRYAPNVLMLTPPLLAVWSASLIGLRLIPPRARWRRIAMEPGTVACLAGAISVTLVLVWKLCWVLVEGLIGEGWWHYTRPRQAPMGAAKLAAFGVVLTWTAMVIGKRWRLPMDWIERFGRIVGVLWVMASLGESASELLDLFWPCSEDFDFSGDGSTPFQ